MADERKQILDGRRRRPSFWADHYLGIIVCLIVAVASFAVALGFFGGLANNAETVNTAISPTSSSGALNMLLLRILPVLGLAGSMTLPFYWYRRHRAVSKALTKAEETEDNLLYIESDSVVETPATVEANDDSAANPSLQEAVEETTEVAEVKSKRN